MQLLQKHATFSRILVDISGNSIRPVRCSTNKPSGAVKIAVVTNVWAKDMAKKFKAEVKHHLLLSCWSLRTCSQRWNSDPRQTRASRTWGCQLLRKTPCNKRGRRGNGNWVRLQAALFAMAAPIWFPSAPVIFLFSNECNGSMLSGTALVFAGLVQRAFLDEVVAHSGFRQTKPQQKSACQQQLCYNSWSYSDSGVEASPPTFGIRFLTDFL